MFSYMLAVRSLCSASSMHLVLNRGIGLLCSDIFRHKTSCGLKLSTPGT